MSHLHLKGEIHTLHSQRQKEIEFLVFGAPQVCLHSLCDFFSEVYTQHFSLSTCPYLMSSLSDMVLMFSACTINVLWAPYSHMKCHYAQLGSNVPGTRFKV